MKTKDSIFNANKNRFVTPLTWPGGKSKKWNLLKSYFPEKKHRFIYMEPFFGGGSVGLNALAEKMFASFVFNDYDTELMNFWNVMHIKNVKTHFKSSDFYPYITLREAIEKFTLNEKITLNNPLDFVARK